MENKYLPILEKFGLNKQVKEILPFGNGHINDTFKLIHNNGESRYVLQRINHQIFNRVDILQRNIQIVTEHIYKKLEERGEQDIDRKVLKFLSTDGGDTYYFDGENYWRVCLMISHSQSFEKVTPQLSFQAGKAFGEFQAMLSDLPEDLLQETIPNFHNMEFRLQEFRKAVQNDVSARLKEVNNMVQYIEYRADSMCMQERLYRDGKLKKRINHCDTKVNNVLFDESGRVLCVIDLDTVMPGFVLSDFGDFIRTGANTGAEDAEDLSSVTVDMNIFKSYVRGYLESARSFLTPLEINLLPYGARLLTYMQAVRFLTDYLNGDVYYKVHKPGHNFIRAQAQLKLLQRLDEVRQEMEDYIAETE